MNKQQLMDKISLDRYLMPDTDYKKGYNMAHNHTLSLLNQQPTTQTSQNTPPHYQGTIQPIDLINAQDLNFNLGNVVKYVCRAGKKQGENILSDLEKAKDYINFEIERFKKWIISNI